MSYTLKPLNNNVAVVELKTNEVKELTGKTLFDPSTGKLDVLSYGRVVASASKDFTAGDIVLFQKLSSHKSNFGTPRQLLVPIEYVEGKLEQTDANG